MGYATEAGEACLRYGFHNFKAASLGSIVDPANPASIKAASRVCVFQPIADGISV